MFQIGYVDLKCISSLLTLEHLSLMCQGKFMKLDKLNGNISHVKPSSYTGNNTQTPRRKMSVNVNRNSFHNMTFSPSYTDCSSFHKTVEIFKSNSNQYRYVICCIENYLNYA